MSCEHCREDIYYGTRTERTQNFPDPEGNLEMWRHVETESPTCARGSVKALEVHLENPPDTGPAMAKKRWEGGE